MIMINMMMVMIVIMLAMMITIMLMMLMMMIDIFTLKIPRFRTIHVNLASRPMATVIFETEPMNSGISPI